jgi:tetratricopeptide (TPR) repeat protein
MTEKNQLQHDRTQETVEKVTGFWHENAKKIGIGIGAVVILIGGWFAYKIMVSDPNEQKASEAMFQAEAYFRQDSVRLALDGDNINPGFLKVMSKFSGTKAAKMARFYAGSCYLKLGDFNNAVKQLDGFSSSSDFVTARAKALLGDAYSELGKKEDAVKLYQEAGTLYDKDENFSPQYLFRAAFLYETMGKNNEAIDLYKKIKSRYPLYREYDIDKYLARLGVTE